RRELPDHGGEPFAQRRRGVTAANHWLFDVDQLFVMRDVPVSLDGKRKIFRRLVAPLLKRAFLRQLVEGAVHLNAGETFRAKKQPLFLGRVAVETVPPGFVIPAAGADV